LGVPDERDRPVFAPGTAGAAQSVDIADSLAVFAKNFPAWIGADGYPLTWLHYRLGIDAAEREYARETLRIFQGASAPYAEKHERQSWHRTTKLLAGYVGDN
jgi:hypothetical protein